MAGVVDLFMVYQFIKRLATPFDEWEAYKRGVIDEKGNILKDKSERGRNLKDSDSFTKFDLLVLKIKRIIEKFPASGKRTANYAAALWFMKEHQERGNVTITEETLLEYIELTESAGINRDFAALMEEPTLSAGGGQVAGIGVGSDGEPGFTKKAMNKYKRDNMRTAKARAIVRWSRKGTQ